MGCCASTNKSSPLQNSLHISNSGDSKSPPPSCPLTEKETVKEVLSENPTTATLSENHHEIQFKKTVGFSRNAEEKKRYRNGALLEKPFVAFGNDELPAVASTLSGSKEMKERKGDGFHEIQRRPPARFRNRSFSGEAKRENTVGKCPVRRSESSPGRNGRRPGIGRRRESSGRRESSERRQRSPVMRTDRRSGSSVRDTGHAGSGSGERIRKADGRKENVENTWPPTSSELLENPPVSLECFIFL